MYKSKFKEAKNIKSSDAFKPFLKDILFKDEMINVWHGTNTFWALYFCLKGVDSDIEPPTKTLGRGSMSTGFSKIKSNGLFVSAERTSGFLQYVQIEVKPSELGISLEMSQNGYKEDQILDTLALGDCIIVKPLKANRIIKVRSNNKEYSRKEFINSFPDPNKYLIDNYKVNFYNDNNPIKMKFMKNQLFAELKTDIELRGERKQEIIKEYIEAFSFDLKHGNVLSVYGITDKDMLDIINWLKNQV